MKNQNEGNPGSDKALDEVMHVILSLNSDRDMVVRHMQETPIRALGGRTIAKALSDGDADKVLRYLQTISGGQNG